MLITGDGFLYRREQPISGDFPERPRLGRSGDSRRANLRYMIPADALDKPLALHLTHERWGPIAVTLVHGDIPAPLDDSAAGHEGVALVVTNVERLPAPPALGLEEGLNYSKYRSAAPVA